MDIQGRARQRLKDLKAAKCELAWERLQATRLIEEIDVKIQQITVGEATSQQFISEMVTAEAIAEAKEQEAAKAAKKTKK